MFFTIGKTNALHNKTSSFQQQADELIPEAWEQMQEEHSFRLMS